MRPFQVTPPLGYPLENFLTPLVLRNRKAIITSVLDPFTTAVMAVMKQDFV